MKVTNIPLPPDQDHWIREMYPGTFESIVLGMRFPVKSLSGSGCFILCHLLKMFIMEKTDLNYIRNFIIEGKVREALEELLNILQRSRSLHGRLRDDVIILRTQLNEVERRENLNLVSADESGRERAHLQKAILDVINNLEEPSEPPPVVTPMLGKTGGSKPLVQIIAVALLLLLAGAGFIFRNYLFPSREKQETSVQQTAPPGQTSGGGAGNIQPAQPGVTSEEPVVITQQTEQTSQQTDESDQPATNSGGTVHPVRIADICISNWRFVPDPPVEGEATRVEFIVENKGNKSSGNFSVEWWASVNAPAAEKTWEDVALGAGERRVLSCQYKGYPSWYSNLQTKIVLDPDRQVADKDRSNNIVVKNISVTRRPPVDKADIVVSDLQFSPYPPVEGKATKVSFTVANTGTAATGMFSIQWWAGIYYPSPEKTWSGIGLAPGEKKTFSYIYPGYPSPYGTLQTKVVVDPAGQISDRDRSNNTLVKTISVTPRQVEVLADLAVSGWRFTPDPPVQKQATRIEFIVENKGGQAARNFSVQWWAGVNFPGAEKTWSNITLAAGERRTFSYSYAGYASWYGQLQTKIVVDPDRQVNDADRSNNEKILTIRVLKPNG